MALLPFSTQVLPGEDFILPAPAEDLSGQHAFGSILVQTLLPTLNNCLQQLNVYSTFSDFGGSRALISRAGVDGEMITTVTGVTSMPQLSEAIAELPNPSLVLVYDLIRRLAEHEEDFGPETLTTFLVEAYAAKQKNALKGVAVGSQTVQRPWPLLEQKGLLTMPYNYGLNPRLFGVALATMRMAQLPNQAD
jgi:hypothetical protein